MKKRDSRIVVDIDTWYYRAKVLLGYSDEEFWEITLKKLVVVFEKYCEWNGYKKEKEEEVPLSVLLGG